MSFPSADATGTQTGFEIIINGQPVRISGAPPTMTLLDWLRANGRTGSKQGCAEGDCGACTVALLERDAAGKPTYRAINSCIALLPMFAGREVVTVEGLATPGSANGANSELHPVQAAMVEQFGSQCGYCTPGFVVSMFEGYCRGSACQTPSAINDQLSGNLCRCTGYRPIRDAMVAALAKRTESADANDRFLQRLQAGVAPIEELNYAGNAERFFRPTSLSELFRLKNKYTDAKLVAGATEI